MLLEHGECGVSVNIGVVKPLEHALEMGFKIAEVAVDRLQV